MCKNFVSEHMKLISFSQAIGPSTIDLFSPTGEDNCGRQSKRGKETKIVP